MSAESAGTRPLETNRDVYRFVCELHRQHQGLTRTLEEYLRALWRLGGAERARGELPVATFGELLAHALTAEVPPYDPAWERLEIGERLPGFPGWERAILSQIVDLKELRAAGAYEDPLRYFGTDAPRGGRWYNFDALTYLECAAAGSFGADFADDSDDSEHDADDSEHDADDSDSDDTKGEPPLRIKVPGQVAVLGPDGALTSVDAADLPPDELEDLTAISWEDFRSFLYQGQYYE